MNAATILPTSQMIPSSSGSTPPNGYAIGTILHGTNARKGNLWIITVDQSFDGSLLFDGLSKTVVPDSQYKRDTMSPGMVIADPNDIARILGGWKYIPTWAQSLILTSPKPLPLPKPSVVIPHGAMQQINKAFATITSQKRLQDLGLTKTSNEFASDFDCPSRREGGHEFKPYYGFSDTYDYCQWCDKKRPMSK